MKEYIRLDPITERKLMAEINKLHYQIPEDDYINLRNIILSCVQKHTINYSQIYQIFSLLADKQTNISLQTKSLKGKFKHKRTEKNQLIYRMIAHNENNLWLIEFDRKNGVCKLLNVLLILNHNQQSQNKGLFYFNR